MSEEILNNLQRWGLPDVIWRSLRKLRNQKFDPPFRIDSPENCLLGKHYWENCSYRSYQYQFNSWGFRDCDFDQYQKEVYPGKVNVCIGDSFTINFGDTQEHAWPQLLSQKFQEPTLNIGIDSLSSYYYSSVVTKVRQLFNVNKIFVLYNLFEDVDALTSSVKKGIITRDVENRAKFLKNHCYIPDVYWQFIPPWAFTSDEMNSLYKYFPGAHNYLNGFDLNWKNLDVSAAMSSDILFFEYQKISGKDWIDYKKFVESMIVDPIGLLNKFSGIDRRLIKDFLNCHFSKLLLTGRDGWHMNHRVNQLLADYFFQQSTKNLST